jgi:hypothetical protein
VSRAGSLLRGRQHAHTHGSCTCTLVARSRQRPRPAGRQGPAARRPAGSRGSALGARHLPCGQRPCASACVPWPALLRGRWAVVVYPLALGVSDFESWVWLLRPLGSSLNSYSVSSIDFRGNIRKWRIEHRNYSDFFKSTASWFGIYIIYKRIIYLRYCLITLFPKL